jgi:hypothetical protein
VFSLKNNKPPAVFGSKFILYFVIILPIAENARSEDVLVAGIQRYFSIKFNNNGYILLFIFQKFNRSSFINIFKFK